MSEQVSQTFEMPKHYDPSDVEGRRYEWWRSNGLFHGDVDPEREPFSIVIPPPNVTGSLHTGHALDMTLQDILVRWKRMQGYSVAWIPGTDHAGIATQIKVEKALAEQGTDRHELGRAAFLERVWKWKESSHDTIVAGMQRIGVSCDWDRERFTLDDRYSKAVREVFVTLYEKGLIYQGDYIINWCPRCRTALSDLEVEHEEAEGGLYHVRYPLGSGDDSGFITVATTRPETMLGDTAVAVHPEDERYRGLVGQRVQLPLTGRTIPIIADEYVDPDFGTGMVKITPAHDPNDFEVGRRHDLPVIRVIDEEANMSEDAGRFAGMDRFECRRAVVDSLDSKGLLAGRESVTHAVGRCQRCNTVVEPLVSKQWFVKMEPLAQPALEAVREGRIRFVPDRFSKNYLHWVENIRDWCISRQLWWGHRIPVWYCVCGEEIVSRTDPGHCPACGGTELRQDPDVLDTWFSSSLWPFATLGWPEKTPELDYYYPTSVLVTGFDIIYFWVARMMFMGLEFMKEIPFPDVLIHGLVRDALGRKMSKSLGTGVDPLQVIDEYGADALRFTLVIGTAAGNDMRWHPEKVEASRNFANKIWNAARFCLMNLDGFDPERDRIEQAGADGSTGENSTGGSPANGRRIGASGASLPLSDRWILSRLQSVAAEVERHLRRYDVGEGARELYDFFWTEFCDWYIEMAKPRLQGREGEGDKRCAQWVTRHVLETALRLLHPYMPFLTEEIWQRLPHEGKSIMRAAWPADESGWRDVEAESEMARLMEAVRAIRNVRTEKQVAPSRRIPAIMQAAEAQARVLERNALQLKTLAGLSELTVAPLHEQKPERAIPTAATGVEIYLPLEGLLDVEAERRRLAKELKESGALLQRSEGKLQNDNFVKKAPPEVVDRERKTAQSLQEKIARLRSGLSELGGVAADGTAD